MTVLPIDEITMPEEDVSDLQDVFDAINRMCDTMRTSTYEDSETIEETTVVDKIEEVVETIETVMKVVECDEELMSPAEVVVNVVDAYRAERWSDALVSPPEEEDTEPAPVTAEPLSEMYYTASSEVSLLSDGEVPDKPSVDEEAAPQEQEKEGVTDSPLCRACLGADETARHILLECPGLAEYRAAHLGTPRSLQEVIGNVKSLLGFLEELGWQ